ncbi:hypothetical protein IC608_07730 [Devosia sp. PTR5]|uniref:DUF5330 domain-containing protein n=1 Tax=Devosia oryzisoli TaxID=2774138 RepID=A0A927FWM3_9HYPH|nr:hypothetical protein [Devosia oryzisoli]MBD8065361.1 hypothetical protein [Devosia oryzisoli]
MFLLLRSAFWLTLAFMVIRPGFDVQQAAASVSADALSRGSQFVASQIDAIECQDFTCASGKAIAAAALTPAPPAAAPMHDDVAAVPFPKPRPGYAG